MLLLNIIKKAYRESVSVSVIIFEFSDLERSMSRPLKFWKLISRKGAELGHMLLLNINRKPHMGSPMTLSHLALREHWKVNIKVTQISKAYLVKQLS